MNYSENEKKLFTALGHGDLMKHLAPVTLFDWAARKAFMENTQGPAVEALRRAVKAISQCSPYRSTPEFEKLIKF